MRRLLSAAWVFLSCCRMGLYPYLCIADTICWAQGNVQIQAIVIDWEIPDLVFESHWNAPWFSDDIPF